MTLEEALNYTSTLGYYGRDIDLYVTTHNGGRYNLSVAEVDEVALEIVSAGRASRIYYAAVALYQHASKSAPGRLNTYAPHVEGELAIREAFPDESPAQLARYLRKELGISGGRDGDLMRVDVPYGSNYYPVLAWYVLNRMITYVAIHGLKGALKNKFEDTPNWDWIGHRSTMENVLSYREKG